MRFVATRFRSPVPAHSARPHWRGHAVANLAGQIVHIGLPPQRVIPGDWRCDTEWQWLIHPEDTARLGGGDVAVAVCIHQVELD